MLQSAGSSFPWQCTVGAVVETGVHCPHMMGQLMVRKSLVLGMSHRSAPKIVKHSAASTPLLQTAFWVVAVADVEVNVVRVIVAVVVLTVVTVLVDEAECVGLRLGGVLGDSLGSSLGVEFGTKEGASESRDVGLKDGFTLG